MATGMHSDKAARIDIVPGFLRNRTRAPSPKLRPG
jgi:hypothetical protein